MKPKQPNRWERIVDKVLERDGSIYHHEVTDLLRKEHAAVVRLIKKEFRRFTPYYRSRAMILEEILDQLKQRKK